jgi:predicted nucleotidyltransferase
VYRVYRDVADGQVFVEVLVCAVISSVGLQAHLDIELAAFGRGRNVQVPVEHFHIRIGVVGDAGTGGAPTELPSGIIGNMVTLPVEIPHDAITEFCVRNHIRKLSLFGSILTPRFGDESDIDMLVEFEPKRGPGLFGIVRMERELSEMIGRKVDLRTAGDLSRFFRAEVVASAIPQYEQR